jgi:hypothetical protein
MKENKESPERQRERLRQEELKRNPGGSMRDASNRAQYGGLLDLVNSLGWKGMGILILVILAGFIMVSIFFN